MRKLKVWPHPTVKPFIIERICDIDDLPYFWFFVSVRGVETGTARSQPAAQVAAEKAAQGAFAQHVGYSEPSPSFTPVSYAHANDFETVKAWRKHYLKARKDFIKGLVIRTGQCTLP